MKDRFYTALKISGLKLPDIAVGIGLKPDTLRKAIARNSMNDGYLVLIEQKFNISKDWLKEGVKPVMLDINESIVNAIELDAYSMLERIEPEKIVAYILLKESIFKKIPAFVSLIDKLKASQLLEGIANRNKI